MELTCTMPRPDVFERGTLTKRENINLVDIVLFDGFSLPDMAAVIEIFHKANALTARYRGSLPEYDVSLISTSGGRIASSSAVYVWTEGVESHRAQRQMDRLFIAGGIGAHRALHDDRLLLWLREACRVSTTVHPIAEGRLLCDAAEANESRVDHAGRVDTVKRETAPRLLDESMRPVRAALDIVTEDLGADLAQCIVRSMTPQGETPSDAFFPTRPDTNVSEKINASARWLEENAGRSVSMEHAAKIASMSERNFLRRFKSEMGVTPSDYLLYARLNMSCRMLVETRLPIDKIARHCGIGSGGHLAKLFRKHLSTTPTEYRKRNEAAETVPATIEHSNNDLVAASTIASAHSARTSF